MKVVELYPDVIKWFKRYLGDRHSHSEIDVYDTHKTILSRFILKENFYNFFPEHKSFYFNVDITAVIRTKNNVSLAFVEYKNKPVTLKDVGQILGFSMVAKPLYSFIISPEGISDALNSLLRTFGRYDILEYEKSKRIKIAQWDISRREIDSRTFLPPGEFI